MPLSLLIVFGLIRFGHEPQVVTLHQLAAPGWSGWLSGLLLLLFAYSGFEDSLTTTGEVREPRRSIPLALIAGLGVCITIYTLIQFVVVATLSTGQTERPLAAVAQVLFGRAGARFVELAALVSTYGWLSTFLLNTPRYLFAISAHREFPAIFGRLHPRFGTPHISIFIATGLGWLLAVTGSFQWCVLLSAGASIVYYAAVCAALLRLRRLQPAAAGFRLPFGTVFSLLGIAISLVLLTQLHLREVLFMTITALVAAINWWRVRRDGGVKGESGAGRDYVGSSE
jgi:amino acid transporter